MKFSSSICSFPNTGPFFKLPDDLPSGNYSLELGVVFHSSIEHTIPIGNKGITADGWYSLGKIKIIN